VPELPVSELRPLAATSSNNRLTVPLSRDAMATHPAKDCLPPPYCADHHQRVARLISVLRYGSTAQPLAHSTHRGYPDSALGTPQGGFSPRERQSDRIAKVDVEGSSPFTRSSRNGLGSTH